MVCFLYSYTENGLANYTHLIEEITFLANRVTVTAAEVKHF